MNANDIHVANERFKPQDYLRVSQTHPEIRLVALFTLCGDVAAIQCKMIEYLLRAKRFIYCGKKIGAAFVRSFDRGKFRLNTAPPINANTAQEFVQSTALHPY